MLFTPDELDYLDAQPLGRLATVDAQGAPQNNPVGFQVDRGTGDILIGGLDLTRTRKFRNVRGNPHVAFVVDDLVSTSPWRVRGVEIRGVAAANVDVDPPRPGMSRALIRIAPTWVGSWGIDDEQKGLTVRRAA
jgi:pyridoxamine 5'-phosphate oxidase family protein